MIILDDVMTSGKTACDAIDMVKGVIQALDRHEVDQDGISSTVKEIEAPMSKGRVRLIVNIKDLMI